jgi:hypothetical protein
MNRATCRPRTPGAVADCPGVVRAAINRRSPLAFLWREVFENGVIPLVWPNPFQDVEGDPAYAIATASLTRRQRVNLARLMSVHLGIERERIERLFAWPQCGVPIPAEHVLVRNPRRSAP